MKLDEMWREPRIFSKFEALYDIKQEGSMTISVRKLAKRWKWGERKVRSFLEMLKGDGIKISSENGITIIQVTEICDTVKDTAKDTVKTVLTNKLAKAKTQQKTQQKTQLTDIKRKEFDKRKHAFGMALAPYVGQYPKEMIRSFYDYWSEANRSGVKMRFELEKTWELSRRLRNWADRDKNYANRTDSKQDANRYAVEQFITDRKNRVQGVVNEVEKPF